MSTNVPKTNPFASALGKHFRLLLGLAAVLFLSACSDDNDRTSSGGRSASKNIVETVVGAAPEFTTLTSALTTAGLVSTLAEGGPFTVFAPTNAAFAKIQHTVDSLIVAQLTTILNYHVVPGIKSASSIPHTTGAPPTVGAPIQASNGVIFPISEVLLP